MDKIWFLKLNGILYCKIGRMTTYFTPTIVKRNQRILTLRDKHSLFNKRSFKYFYSYI